MADAPDPGNAGFYSSRSRYRSSVRQQTIVAVCSPLAEMVSGSATTSRAFHRHRSAARTLPQPNCSLGASRLFWFCRWIRSTMSLDLDSIHAAHERIRAYIHRTPVMTSSRLDGATPAAAGLFFKCENFQKIGAFKARGATNAVFSLDDVTARRGVATHSSGNHGAAVARAAKLRGIPAHIVMPSNSAKVKIRAVESYGAHVVFCEPTEQAREATCAEVLEKTGAMPIHSFENIRRYVDDSVRVSEQAIVSAMRTIWETMKIVIEPSAAVPYAAVIENKIAIEGKRVGIILTGGNLDLDALPWNL